MIIPNDIYRPYDAINASLLKSVLSHSYHKAIIPINPTPAMQLGTNIHCCILEPYKWASDYCRLSDGIDLRTKAGKAEKADAESSGKIALKADDFDMIENIAALTKSYSQIAEYFHEDTMTEVSMTFHLPEYPNLEFKSQIDLYDPKTKSLVDLKTTADITLAEKKFNDLHYALQLRFYQHALEANGYQVDHVSVLFVEAQPPHTPALFHLTDSMLEVGESHIHRALGRYLEEKMLDKPRLIIRTLDAPSWFKDQK